MNMAKRRSRKEQASFLNLKNVAIIAVVAIALLLVANRDNIRFESPSLAVVPGGSTDDSSDEWSPGGGGGGSSGPACSGIDFESTVLDDAGSMVTDWQTSCIDDLDGVWTLDNNELSCYWDSTVGSVDCDGVGAALLRNYCEDTLLGEWTCDMSLAYLGCTCGESVPPAWNDEVQCAWQTIDQKAVSVPGMTRIEYKNALPVGDFMWSWEFTTGLGVEITKGMTSVQYYPNSGKDEHVFASDGEDWGIALSNSYHDSVGGTVKLHQWICEGDPLNFDPHMFDELYSTNYFGTQDDCVITCEGEGYQTGYVAPLQGCTQGTQIGGCCCES
jgi:hypothetical protein